MVQGKGILNLIITRTTAVPIHRDEYSPVAISEKHEDHFSDLVGYYGG